MKRCPQCSFLYLDSDQLCDLDQTPLLPDDFGTDHIVIGHSEQKAEAVSVAAVLRPKRKRRLNPKTLLAIVGGLVIGLTMLIVYQRSPTLQASQIPPASQAQGSQVSRASQVAQQVSSEVVGKAELQPGSESPGAPDIKTVPSVDPPSSTPVKTTAKTRPDPARVRVSSNPVSTGDITKAGRGPVTIRLADGSTLEADEVWRTKAGIWYRRKGIVTFIKPNRVRAMNH